MVPINTLAALLLLTKQKVFKVTASVILKTLYTRSWNQSYF